MRVAAPVVAAMMAAGLALAATSWAAAAAPQSPAVSAAAPANPPTANGAAAAQGPGSTVPGPGSAATSAAAEDIRDIRGPKPIASPWLLWLIAGAVVLAALVGFALWRRARRRRATPPLTDLEVALARLEAAQALLQPGCAREFSIEVSATVREFIERRFDVMAAHRTTHEFLHDLMGSSHSSLARYRELLGEFLELCDLAKFGGWNLSAGQMATMLESARRFVQSAAASAGTSPSTADPSATDSTGHSASGKPRVSLPST